MKNVAILIVGLGLWGCAIPKTPSDVDLHDGARHFRSELFDTGSRGQIILSASDNISKDGFFGINYTNIIEVENLQTAEKFTLLVDADSKKTLYDTAMLPIGKYRVTDAMLQNISETRSYVGNTTVTSTEVTQFKNFFGNRKIEFDVRPKEVIYLGHFDFVKGDPRVSKDGAKMLNKLNISDKSKEIPNEQKQKWKAEFGKSFEIRLAKDAK